MWVTSLPRRTDNVKAPGLDEDNRARKEPSNPRSRSIFSASTPDTDGWNHLREVISFVVPEEIGRPHKSAVGFQPWLFSPAAATAPLTPACVHFSSHASSDTTSTVHFARTSSQPEIFTHPHLFGLLSRFCTLYFSLNANPHSTHEQRNTMMGWDDGAGRSSTMVVH